MTKSINEKIEEFEEKFVNLCTIVIPKNGKHKDIECKKEVKDFLTNALEESYQAGKESVIKKIEKYEETDLVDANGVFLRKYDLLKSIKDHE